MDFKPDELSKRLRAEGEAVLAFLNGLSPEDWNRTIYAEGYAWCIRDLLAHFIAAEQGFQELIQNVASGGSGIAPDFAIDEYNHRTVAELGLLDLEVLVAQYAMVRERTAALVAGLSPQQLAQTGRHPAVGTAAVAEMVRMIYHHNNLHLRDVRRVLKAEAASGGGQG